MSLTHLQVAGRARGGGEVGREQPRVALGGPGEGAASSQEAQRRLRGAGVAVGGEFPFANIADRALFLCSIYGRGTKP